MRKKYVTRRRTTANIGDDLQFPSFMTMMVFETDPSPQPTGLLDADGTELFSVWEMDEIGFIRHGS